MLSHINQPIMLNHLVIRSDMNKEWLHRHYTSGMESNDYTAGEFLNPVKGLGHLEVKY